MLREYLDYWLILPTITRNTGKNYGVKFAVLFQHPVLLF